MSAISNFQISSGSKKDLNARDFLPKSILSAVTRKRKKSLGRHLSGSGVDDDSDHEPVKANNFRGGEARGQEEDGRENEEAVKGEHILPKKEKRQGKENVSVPKDSTVGKGEWGEEVEKDARNKAGSSTKGFQSESGPTSTTPAQKLRPNSFLYSHQYIQSASLRPPPITNPPSSLRNPNLARGHPTIPFWICPTRPPNLYQAAGRQPDWNQSVTVHYRQTGGGRVRATSMNLDLEQDRSEERVRGWEADRVEVIRMTEGAPRQHGGFPQGSLVASASIQQIDSLPLPSPSSQCIGHSSHGSSIVVLRRSAPDPRDKMRAWRRHTVVV